ncbi:MAG: response regulator, partial [Elusimicrobiota bacterium]
MKEKIILVDDDRMLLKSMQRVLEKEGYETAGVDNCEDALQLLKEDFYELVVTDIRMPGMDGIDFLERLRKVQAGKKKSHVIIITGYASEDVPVKAIKLNASDYLMKPFETDEFLYSIRKNMQIARLEKERARFVEELQETNRKLEESNRELEEAREKLVRKERLSAIGKLASGVGHELRNPLGSIKNVAFYLQNYVDIDDEDAKEYINTLSEEVNSADKILSDLLSFSRTITLNKSEFNFKKIIESSLKSVTIDENISVDVNVSGECEKGYGDPDKLKQVFKNLIDNTVQAIKEEGEIHINA